MEKILLTGTGGAPHVGAMGISFQAGKDDKLEFSPVPGGSPGINALILYIDNEPKCVINYSLNEYTGTEAKYTHAATSKEYTITLTNSDILLS